MGGIGNVVVNAVVRTLTRKAVGKAMKSAKSAGGKRKRPDQRRVPQKANKAPGVSLCRSRVARRIKRWILIEADEKKNCVGTVRSVPRPSLA